MDVPVGVVEAVGSKDNLITIFDDRLTGYKNMKFTLVGVMDSELMAIELESNIGTVVDKYSRFCDSCADNAVLEVFKEKDFCLLENVDLDISTVHDLERTPIRALFGDLYLLIGTAVDTRDAGFFPLNGFNLLLDHHFLHSKILISSFEFELLLRFCLLS